MDLFKEAKELNFPTGQYALFGSSPIAIRGIRDSHDLDIIVDDDLFFEIKKSNLWELKLSSFGDEYLHKNDIDLFKEWRPGEWDIKLLIKDADIIDGLPFVQLKEVIRWKRLMNREKDLKDIELINKFLDYE